MLKFGASIFGGELPIGLGVVGIAVVLPGGDFLDEGLFVGNAAIEAPGLYDVTIASEKKSFAASRIELKLSLSLGSR
jgi:hypothetical protein